MNMISIEGLDAVKALVDKGSDLASIINAFLSHEYTIQNGKVVVDPDILNDVKEAQVYLDEVVGLSPGEIEIRTKAYNQNISSMNGSYIVNDRLNNNVHSAFSNLGDIMDLVDTNEPSSPEKDEALFLLEEIGMTITSYRQVSVDFPQLTPEEWHSVEIRAATNHLQRKIQVYEAAREKVDETNAAIRIIRSYL